MEVSAVETLLLSAQFLQRVGVEGSEHFLDLRGAKVLEYNSEARRKSLIALCGQLSQPLLAEIVEEARLKKQLKRGRNASLVTWDQIKAQCMKKRLR